MISKPFKAEGIEAPVGQALHMHRMRADARIRTGGILVDLDARSVEVDGMTLRLTHAGYSIIELLARRKGERIKRDRFIAHLHPDQDAAERKIVDVFVANLRKKLGPMPAACIRTHRRGSGFSLDDP